MELDKLYRMENGLEGAKFVRMSVGRLLPWSSPVMMVGRESKICWKKIIRELESARFVIDYLYEVKQVGESRHPTGF